MKGTEKQIKWAEDIKAKFYKKFSEEYINAYYTDEDTRAQARQLTAKAFEIIDAKYDDAKMWIDYETNKNGKYSSDAMIKCGDLFNELAADSDVQAAMQ